MLTIAFLDWLPRAVSRQLDPAVLAKARDGYRVMHREFPSDAAAS
jgi:hypothetical protein